jgi:hypothetical protein
VLESKDNKKCKMVLLFDRLGTLIFMIKENKVRINVLTSIRHRESNCVGICLVKN